MQDLLKRFPKTRPPLPEAYRERYVFDYRHNRYGKSGAVRLAAALEGWMHRRIAEVPGKRTLELGAGTLNHLPYERNVGRYDVVEPFRELLEDAPGKDRIGRFYDDIRDVPTGEQYDRIISIAVLEHLTELPDIVVGCAERLGPGGVFAAGIPNEGGLAWYLAWRFGTGTAYRLRTGLSYAPFTRHEHVNQAKEIESVVRIFFRKVSRRRFPVPVLQASLYTVLEAQDPDLSMCNQYKQARQRS